MEPVVGTNDPIFNKEDHNIISFRDLLNDKDGSTVEKLINEGTTRGWAILDFQGLLPREAPPQKYIRILPLQEIEGVFTEFFNLPDETKSGVKIGEGGVGYSSTEQKESLHLHTGRAANTSLPPTLKKFVSDLSFQLDEMAMTLLEHLAKYVFAVSPATFAHRSDLPVAFGDHVGMLDIVHYFNEKSVVVSPPIGHSTEEVNVVPHYDPGFFSISIFSSLEGLQLFDPVQQKWFGGPVNTEKGQENYGVLWFGKAASDVTENGRLKPGIHRVAYPSVAKSRLTVWYEVCTVDQVNQDFEPKQLATVEEAQTVQLVNLPGSKSLEVKKGENVLSKIERHYGVPMGKTIHHKDIFAAAFSDDYQEGRFGPYQKRYIVYRDNFDSEK